MVKAALQNLEQLQAGESTTGRYKFHPDAQMESRRRLEIPDHPASDSKDDNLARGTNGRHRHQRPSDNCHLEKSLRARAIAQLDWKILLSSILDPASIG